MHRLPEAAPRPSERAWQSHVSWVYDAPLIEPRVEPAPPPPCVSETPPPRIAPRPRPPAPPDLLGLLLAASFGSVLAVLVAFALGLLLL